MFSKPESRWKAAGIHLAISFAIFIALAAVIVFIWYPGFLFATDGGWQGIRLIAGIDLVLGPLLTLIVYNTAKKSLKTDLACIAAVQIAALMGGCYLVYQERPIAVVFTHNMFTTMSANSFAFYGLNANDIDILNANKKPVWLYNKSNQSESPFSSRDFIESNSSSASRANKAFELYENNLDLIGRRGLLSVDDQPELEEGGKLRYFPMLSRYFEGYLVVDINSGKVVDTILSRSTESYGIKSG